MRNNTALLDITLQTRTQQQIEREGHFEQTRGLFIISSLCFTFLLFPVRCNYLLNCNFLIMLVRDWTSAG